MLGRLDRLCAIGKSLLFIVLIIKMLVLVLMISYCDLRIVLCVGED